MGVSSVLFSAFLLLLLLLPLLLRAEAALSEDGRLLLSFKHGITSDPLDVLSSWNATDTSPCNWNGISCSEFSTKNSTSLRVVSLVLPNSRLAGIIHGNLSLIEHLQQLDLAGNRLAGEIPALGFPAADLIDLSDNLLNGSIPSSLELSAGLRNLNLSRNRISGELPALGFPAAALIDLSTNLLNGSIPSSFILSAGLRNLNLSRNRISGKIPPEFAAKIPPGAAVDFSFNNISGEIPDCKPLLAQPAGSFEGNVGLTRPPPALAVEPNPVTTAAARKTLKPAIIAAIITADIVGVILLLLASTYAYKILEKRKRKEEEESDNGSVGSVSDKEKKAVLVTVSGDELDLETLLRASAYILGSRGSSILYKAVLSDVAALAVRRIGEEGGAADKFRDFEAQVRGISKLRHPNLLGIRGFYWSVDEKLLIYDYFPNGSLANVAYRKIGASPFHLSWESRLRIARGVARALAFLHEKKHVHGNLKPSNVLLRHDLEPVVADFALDRLLAGGTSAVSAAAHSGSMRSNFSHNSQPETAPLPPSAPDNSISLSPYQAPETLKNLKPSAKCDVYSFGVVLLELLAGRVISAVDCGGDGRDWLRVVDPAIRADVAGAEEVFLRFFELAVGCAAAPPQRRPSMKEAATVLDRLSSSFPL